MSSPIDGKTVKGMKVNGNTMLIDFHDGSQMILEPGVKPTDAGHFRLSLGVQLTAPTITELSIPETNYSLEVQTKTGAWVGFGRFDLISQMAAFQEALALSMRNTTVRVVDAKTRLVFKTFENGKVI